MKKSKEISDRFKEVFLDGTWIANTNYKQQLSDVNWQQATQKINSLNTIALLTFHVNYYLDGIINVFEGGDLDIRDMYSFNAPEIKNEKEWIALKESLFSNASIFSNHIEQLTEENLNSNFVDKKYGSFYRNIEGMIEHAYYHLGQISLLKKLILNPV
ncbi:hypothetical protein [Polaribacter sp. Hel1_85]|uniref:hypothetical protein n=1 Tax=Polaribacter sp. Hel1_85 TaxID=1250005 RepID=UPI00052BA315|nr:hypothetical protein [Polaribacter sp. Hel1_85]KGL62740.1 hypothetical protein PHEL85_2534 [Polaribacter sp. Hel1_85]